MSVQLRIEVQKTISRIILTLRYIIKIKCNDMYSPSSIFTILGDADSRPQRSFATANRQHFHPPHPHDVAMRDHHHHRHCQTVIRSEVIVEYIRSCAQRTPFSASGVVTEYSVQVVVCESLRSIRACGYIVFSGWKFSPNKECVALASAKSIQCAYLVKQYRKVKRAEVPN